jgi:uncharacterized protein (TIGR00730 family)
VLLVRPFLRHDDPAPDLPVSHTESLSFASCRVCVFCGSSFGVTGDYSDLARRVGLALSVYEATLVYGGSQSGLMGVLADEVIRAGRKAIGVYPRLLAISEPAHEGLSELLLVDSLHERKARMNDLADVFLTMPGGMGTLDELSEMITWSMLGLHQKPIGLLNYNNYFAPLIAQIEQMVKEGFLSRSHRDLLHVDDDAERIVAWLVQRSRDPAMPVGGREPIQP